MNRFNHWKYQTLYCQRQLNVKSANSQYLTKIPLTHLLWRKSLYLTSNWLRFTFLAYRIMFLNLISSVNCLSMKLIFAKFFSVRLVFLHLALKTKWATNFYWVNKHQLIKKGIMNIVRWKVFVKSNSKNNIH